ncbi:MAG: DUF6916 family protein [Acidobacteriota bacterium]
MSTNLTEQEFSKHVDTQFKIALAEGELGLTLVEVKAYMPGENEQDGMERFSVFFDGPGDIVLPQKTYQLEHDKMGTIDLFLVPIRGDQNGFRYEAVFNYYKT